MTQNLLFDRRAFLGGLGAVAGLDQLLQVRQEDDPTTIPLNTNLFTRIGSDLTLNRQGPFLFVIDTGAASTSIADDVAARLGLEPAGDVLVHGVTEATVTQSVRLDRLGLQGLVFHDLRCPVFPRGKIGADGLLGLDVLKKYRLGLNIANRYATLAPTGATFFMGTGASTSQSRQRGLRSVRNRFGQLVMNEVYVNGHNTAAFIDSGSQYSIGNLALRNTLSGSLASQTDRARLVSLHGVNGPPVSAELAMVDAVRIGNARLGQMPLLFADLYCFNVLELRNQPAILIGADILGRFTSVSLDFTDNRISFEGLRPA